MGAHLTKHGDGVKDVAFNVENCVGIFKVSKNFSLMMKWNFFYYIGIYFIVCFFGYDSLGMIFLLGSGESRS